ncbi:MAG: UxaA family hydrolase [Candidatus Bathyarchaeia archaeon]
MKKAIQIDGMDNVATVTSDVSEGEAVEVLSPEGTVILRVQVVESVPFGHKIALADLDVGGEVVKYGEVIGVASKPITVGSWVHTHNVESARVPTSAFKEGGG